MSSDLIRGYIIYVSSCHADFLMMIKYIVIYINAFHTKLQQIIRVFHTGFGQNMTRLKYFQNVA